MVRLALVGCALLSALSAGSTAGEGKPDVVGYEEARSRFGPGSEAEVKLAIWCEAHGLTAERMKHLARAVLADPNNLTARGLLGLVADGRGRWGSPEEVAARDRQRGNVALAEYNARREKTPETADAQWKLALWCEQNGLKPEALAHVTAVTRLDPGRSLAWKHLGFRLHAGRWMTPVAIAGEAGERAAQAQADRIWRPRFQRIKGHLTYKDPARRAAAEAELMAVNDPRAAASLLAVFGTGDTRGQRLAVEVLGRIDSPSSSRALAEVAVSSPSETVRRAAAETLRRRDPRDFVERIMDRLAEPLKFHVKPVGGPGETGEILVEGARFNLDRVYNPPQRPNVPASAGSVAGFDPSGALVAGVASAVAPDAAFSSQRPPLANLLPQSGRFLHEVIAAVFGANGGLAALPFQLRPMGSLTATTNEAPPSRFLVPVGAMAVEIERAAYELRGQQRDDADVLRRRNAEVLKANDPVVLTLETALGWSPGSKRSDWERWWNNQRGYVLASRSPSAKPTLFEDVTPNYTPQPIDRFRYDRQIGYYLPNPDCFAAGTPVRTLDGLRPIESVKRGDRVLAQDPKTGALGFQPVVAVHHNPPAEILRITLDGEAILTTGIQRFWKARHGWVMARDLAEGDAVRTLGGLTRVEKITAEKARPVHNLEVAGLNDFFVGTAGLLVHDHTAVDPVESPFDSEAK